MIYSKPNYALGVWAFNGNIVSPSSEKIETGHIVEKPKNEVMNWIQNRQDVGIAHILQNGVAEWDTQTEYPVNAYTRYQGVLYQAIYQNIDKQPNIETGIWKVAFATQQQYSDLYNNVEQIKNQDGYLTYYVRKSEPVMTGKCNGVGYTANVGITSTGNEPVGYGFNTQLTDGFFHDGNSPVVQNNGEIVAVFKTPTTVTEVTKNVVTMDILKSVIENTIDSFRIKVGSLYLTTNSTNPSIVLGYGTWERYAQGRALVGVSDNTSDPLWTRFGGNGFGEYDHTLTVAEIPPHRHQLGDAAGTSGSGVTPDLNSSPPTLHDTPAIGETGGGQSHNNVQPSVTVYVFVRTG